MITSSARFEANSGKSPLEHVVAFLTATPALVSGIYIWVTLFLGVIAFASISTSMSRFGFSEEASFVAPLVFSLSVTSIAIAIIALGSGVIRLKTLEPPEEPSEVVQTRSDWNQANGSSTVPAQNPVDVQELEAAIERLPPQQQKVLLMSSLLHMKNEEIAGNLELEKSVVLTELALAKTALRDQLYQLKIHAGAPIKGSSRHLFARILAQVLIVR